jgi:hypothetical protein
MDNSHGISLLRPQVLIRNMVLCGISSVNVCRKNSGASFRILEPELLGTAYK